MCMRTHQLHRLPITIYDNELPILLEEDPRISRGDDTQPTWALAVQEG